MEAVYLDTHVVVWLHADRTDRMTSRARDMVDRCDPLISPVVLLELQYLHEVGKVVVSPQVLLGRLKADLGLKVCEKSFHEVVLESLKIRWTRDPFDRLITAHAALNQTVLITQNEKIRRHYTRAAW